MRSIKLVLTITAAAAAGALALAAAGASAERHSSPGGRCQVNLNVAPRLITSGDSVLAFGSLRCHGQRGRAPVAGATVQLLEHSSGTPGFGVVQTTTTDARGFYEFNPVAVTVNSAFYARSGAAVSER